MAFPPCHEAFVQERVSERRDGTTVRNEDETRAPTSRSRSDVPRLWHSVPKESAPALGALHCCAPASGARGWRRRLRTRCPLLRKHSRCSCTHPCALARTLCHSGGVLFVHTAEISNCCLCFARRWDLNQQLRSLWWTTPSQCLRYVAQRLRLRCWMCRQFALCYESVCRVEAAAGVSRARAPRDECLHSPSLCHGLVMCTRRG